jgi:hypothetical protein
MPLSDYHYRCDPPDDEAEPLNEYPADQEDRDEDKRYEEKE